jgi:VIT1/CCC1 family predicted Fe2+/Mn2+ transporter
VTEDAGVADDAADSWYEEKQSAWLYRVLASVEPSGSTRSRLFERLAGEAEAQAETWAERARASGRVLPAFEPRLRARLAAALVRRLGVRPMRQVLASLKVRGLSLYTSSHAAGHAMPAVIADVGASHKSVGGGNLRAAVFGANDGLVSNASLVFGMAGAAAEPSIVLLAGIAGLLAGASSMAAGEFVSVRSQRELYEHQIALEQRELEAYPDEEAEELALIYEARGMSLEEARAVARKMLANPAHALDVLSREELGLNPDELGSPWGAAAFSFGAFSIGAVVPLLPFLTGLGGIGASAAVTAASLYGIGATLSLFTGRSAWRGGARMLAIGALAGAVTWCLGRLIGGALV